MAKPGSLAELVRSSDITIALAGNPNVGKSTIFNRLSGTYVMTANYPGKTVELNLAETDYKGARIGLIDLPGTYALGAISEDQWVARHALLEGRPDVVVVVVDATNLSRNLFLLTQLMDLEIPLVLALNLIDQAKNQGITIDSSLLAKTLGLPVISTVATSGEGLDGLMEAVVTLAKSGQNARHLDYGQDIEEKIRELAKDINDLWLGDDSHRSSVFGLTARALSILLLENDLEVVEAFKRDEVGSAILTTAGKLRHEIAMVHGESAALRITRERHGLAGTLAAEVESVSDRGESGLTRLWRFATSVGSGMPLLGLTLITILATLFYFGGLLATLFSSFWAALVSPYIQSVIMVLAGQGLIAKTLLWGLDSGIEAALSVGIPYVMVFYLMLAVLEDSGYLNSVAFLTDRLMHRFGLHGRAIIPIVAGAGCSVPAVIGTRTLSTIRERTIASTLIVMIPCSARTAVILGAVSRYIGTIPALGVFMIVALVIVIVGLILNKVMPGDSTGLVMEMFPFRRPVPLTIIKRTWWRVKDFLFVAMPIVIVGSFGLGALYESGLVYALTKPLAPIVEGWLGLPPVAGLALLLAVLRKELALQLLVTLAIAEYGRGAENLLAFMDGKQLFVYALVNTLYVPCIATIAVLGRELGWKRSAAIISFMMVFTVLLGGVVYRLLDLFW